jgi:hypothetical protein
MNLNEFFNDLAANNSRNYKLDKLKETFGNVSYDKIISTLIVDHYRKNNSK